MDTLKHLHTTRVVIVDDDPDEGNALQLAFAKLGIGAVYTSGDVDSLPNEPLTGIRLLVLDMKLAGENAEDKATLSRLMTVVPQVIGPDNGPFLLIAWTKHKDLVDPFKAQLLKDHPNLFPLAVAYIDKNDVLRREEEEQPHKNADVDLLFSPLENNIIGISDSTFSLLSGALDGLKEEVRRLIGGGAVRFVVKVDVPELVRRITDSLTDGYPLTLLVDWEQRVHTAASDTTLSLFRLGTPRSATRLAEPVLLAEQKTDLIAGITEIAAATETPLPVTPTDLDRAATADQLSPEHQKLLDKVVQKWNGALEQVLAVLAKAAGGKALTESVDAVGNMAYQALMSALNPIMVDQLQSRAADLNALDKQTDRLLSTAKKLTGTNQERAGILNRMLLIARVRDGDTRPQIGNVYIDIDGTSPLFKSVGVDQQILASHVLPKSVLKKDDCNAVISGCLPVLIDITPACDYAQTKVGLVRLVGGMLLKDVACAGFDSHKEIGLIRFDKGEGDPIDGLYRLVIDSRFVTGRPGIEMGQFSANFRLRTQAVVAVQAGCSAHGARPGYTSVTA